MKRFKLMPIMVAIVLMVVAVSCTTMSGAQDGYYDGQPVYSVGTGVYINDPYRGTVLLQRDPWTGRYYEVNSYGYYGEGGYYTRGYRTPYYGRDNRYYRNDNNRRENTEYQPRQTQQPTPQNESGRNEARNKILGNNH